MPSRAAVMKGDGEAGGGSQGGGGAHSGTIGDDDNAASRPSGGRAAGWMIHGACSDAAAPMILAVSLNPALDVTHHVTGVDWSGVNRPREIAAAPGGKGVNVARTLRALGCDVLVTGLAGGVTGDAVRAGLDA